MLPFLLVGTAIAGSRFKRWPPRVSSTGSLIILSFVSHHSPAFKPLFLFLSVYPTDRDQQIPPLPTGAANAQMGVSNPHARRTQSSNKQWNKTLGGVAQTREPGINAAIIVTKEIYIPVFFRVGSANLGRRLPCPWATSKAAAATWLRRAF